jgi:hypothetical protein
MWGKTFSAWDSLSVEAIDAVSTSWREERIRFSLSYRNGCCGEIS